MNNIYSYATFLTLIIGISACGSALNKTSLPGEKQIGIAAYYSDKLNGRPTASGEPYDKTKLTAAHLKLPFGTIVKVTNLSNMRSVKVRVNDRGPFGKNGRIIDLSKKAAQMLGMLKSGIIKVQLEIISLPKTK
jgi:rare lipoprotein A